MTTTTPTMSSSWYCCDCQFGPHDFGLHSTCFQCGTMRCDDCSIETSSFDDTTHCCSHELPAYPSVTNSQISHGTPVTQLGAMPPTMSLTTTFNPGLSLFQGSGSTTSGIMTHGATYMYFCCQCNDGPKVYNVQPQCVMCNHIACASCKPASK